MRHPNARCWCDIDGFLSILHQTRRTHFGARAVGEAKITKSEHFLQENSLHFSAFSARFEALAGTCWQKCGLSGTSR
ncbi:hypothetical protein [Herbaspirillum huttiense]|jgi:hypothetical protein|uniref:hypothetical protein n=1 Tax=Herbaspirillum huttiense TaxID=863372 RepID=UPI002176BF34|nr:hypothetical protein [Herbaspirillum huttiense]UWE16692.1 hypothetical protein NY669_00540 [Herbaspirillum huttiense]